MLNRIVISNMLLWYDKNKMALLENNETDTPFPSTGCMFLNRFSSGLFETWCQLSTQPTFSTSFEHYRTEGVAQCPTDAKSGSTIADHTDHLRVFVLFSQVFVWSILFHHLLHCCAWIALQTNGTPTDVGHGSWWKNQQSLGSSLGE